MTYALVVVEKPKEKFVDKIGHWPQFLDGIQGTEDPPLESSRIAETAWLIDLTKNTGLFSIVVSSAHNNSIPHKVLYFSEPIAQYSFDTPK